jgi:hypothetical protein
MLRRQKGGAIMTMENQAKKAIISEYMRAKGKRGGSSKSPAKGQAARESLAKARAIRSERIARRKAEGTASGLHI